MRYWMTCWMALDSCSGVIQQTTSIITHSLVIFQAVSLYQFGTLRLSYNHQMEFMSGLQVSKLQEAFKLISISNTQAIKRGEEMLEQLKHDPSYYTLICSYLSNQAITPENKLKAALQLREFTDWVDDDEFDFNNFSNLFAIYLEADSKVSKILIQIFSNCTNFDLEIMKLLVSKFQSHTRYAIKIFKLFEKLYSATFDSNQPEIRKIMLTEVINILRSFLHKGYENSEPTEFFYRIFKIFELICLENNSVEGLGCEDKSSELAQLAVIMLNQPDPQNNDKYSIKMKISAMKCLINLCGGRYNQDQVKRISQFSASVWENYIDNPLYTQHCFAYLKIIAQKDIYKHMFRTKPELDQVIQKVFETTVRFIHNENTMYKMLETDPQEFIAGYMLNEDIDEIRKEAMENIRILAFNHHETWIDTVLNWSKPPPIANCVLSFIVDSFQSKNNRALKIDFSKAALEIYHNNIREHLGYLFEKVTGTTPIDKNDVLKFVSQLRFIKTFAEFFQNSQLKIVCLLCSKMALKCEVLSSLCYYLMNDILKILNKQSTFPLQQIGQIYCQAITDMKQNEENLRIEDIFLIESGIKTLQRDVTMVKMIQEPLKSIILVLTKMLETNKQYNVIDVTFSIMHQYLDKIGYEHQFKRSIEMCVGERLYTPYLIKCYLVYLKESTSDKKSAEDIIIEMSRQEYWADNLSDGKVNAKLYAALIKIIPKQSPYYLQILPNFVDIITRITVQDAPTFTNSQNQILLSIIDTILEELQYMIRDTNIQDHFYNLIISYQGFKNNAENVLLKMMEMGMYPTSQESMNIIVLYILRGRKARISLKNFPMFLTLLFQFSRHLIHQQLQHQERFDTLWLKCLQKIMAFIMKKRSEPLRAQFTRQLMDFISSTGVVLANIIPQSNQPKLTSLCQNKFTQ